MTSQADQTTLPAGALPGILAGLERLVVLLGPSVAVADLPPPLAPGPRTDVVALTEGRAGRAGLDGEDTDGAVLVVRDLLELRRAVAGCQRAVSAATLGCVLLAADRPPLTAGRASWPAVVSVRAETDPLCLVVVQLAAPLDLGELVADLSRRATQRHLASDGWPVLAVPRAAPWLWPVGDPLARVGTAEELGDVSGDYPPDVAVTVAADDPAAPATTRPAGLDHHVLGPLSAGIAVPPSTTWADYERLGAERADRELAGGLALGGLDAQLLNPRGFLRRAGGPVATLAPVAGAARLCRVDTDDGPLLLDTRHGPGEQDLARLRALRGVEIPWRGGEGPVGYCRLVAALAMTGVPLVCAPAPSWARALLHPALVEALAGLSDAADLADPLAREVHSIRSRRAALSHHDSAAWRTTVAGATGAWRPPPPRVSVLLATRRPDALGFALRQVVRQRGVDVELVLAGHGHEPDPRLVDEARERLPGGLTCLALPEQLPFGALVNRAAERAGGDVLLKMDDDDWYGPDFVTDLLRARHYSGADVVGTPPEFAFVTALDLTVRRKDATESFRPVVAGGTLMVSREALTAVGGFRPMRRYVDAGLLQGVLAAGGSVYRSHGHGYLLRRTPAGHTWDPGLGYFVSRSRTAEQWGGFRPSVLLEADDRDRPGASR